MPLAFPRKRKHVPWRPRPNVSKRAAIKAKLKRNGITLTPEQQAEAIARWSTSTGYEVGQRINDANGKPVVCIRSS